MKKGYIALSALGAITAASVASVVVTQRVRSNKRQKRDARAELNGK
jgi:hypothetical protein